MVVLSKFSVVKPCKTPALFPADAVPLIDLSKPDAKHLLVKACEEFGFFKVVNHGVPSDFIATLESEALRFFSAPLSEKLKAGPPDPFGYGNKNVGACGDIGWVEYILLSARHPQLNFQKFSSVMGLSPGGAHDLLPWHAWRLCVGWRLLPSLTTRLSSSMASATSTTRKEIARNFNIANREM